MYKIEFCPTGHVFLLPDETAKDLKNKFPEEYKILEKNGKKFRDTKTKSKNILNPKDGTIRDLVEEK